MHYNYIDLSKAVPNVQYNNNNDTDNNNENILQV